MYQNFIGIDIGKCEFVVGIHSQNITKTYRNDETGFRLFKKDYKAQLKTSLVVLETTGGYEKAMIAFLQTQQIAVHRANTRKVKSFIRSHGKLGKSDAIDAQQLALYGFERHAILPLYQASEDEDLRTLVERRRELKQMIVKEKNRRQGPAAEKMQRSFNAIIKALNDEIEIINEDIQVCCQSKKDFDKKLVVLKTIPGIGDIIAVDLLATLPELGKLNRKEIASLGNLAPHPNESGAKVGYRRTRGGRPSVKAILFMAAMTASRSKSRLGDFYQSLVGRGKKKMVALTALMRKILVIANARMREYLLEIDIKGN